MHPLDAPAHSAKGNTMTDAKMILTMKDRLALQRDVIGRLHNQMDKLAKVASDLASENKWLKGEKT
jgi:hypothetical protein